DLGRSAPLRAAIDRWLAALSTPPGSANAVSEAECRRLGQAVRRMTWDRVAPFVGTATTAYVVGDGPLVALPWQALPAGTTRYLGDTGPTIQGLDAEREIVLPPPATVGAGLLAIGGPAFDAETNVVASVTPMTFRGPLGPCDAAHPLALPPLPAA